MEWQWHQLDQCRSSAPLCRQITSPAPHYSNFSQAGCSSWRQTNSVKAVKEGNYDMINVWHPVYLLYRPNIFAVSEAPVTWTCRTLYRVLITLNFSPGCFSSLGIKQRTNDGCVWCRIAISLASCSCFRQTKHSSVESQHFDRHSTNIIHSDNFVPLKYHLPVKKVTKNLRRTLVAEIVW